MSTPYRTMSWLGVPALYSHKNNYSCRMGLEQGLNAQVFALNTFPQLFLKRVYSIHSYVCIFTHCVWVCVWVYTGSRLE